MVLAPMDAAGLKVLRNVSVVNHVNPHGHCEVLFRDVRVPRSNLLGEEGSGFALAQARLGPGRIHHCMRSIGQCELALELMTERAQERKTYGKHLHEHGVVAEWIAMSRCEIEQARLLVLKTAWMIDTLGAKVAQNEIAMIKAIVPRLQTTVLDRAIQTFGAMGLSPDTPLADLWTWGRCLRIFDGPDEVHLRAIARNEVKRSRATLGAAAVYLTPPEFD
jgi:acyl-CoA dehydrogenase